MKKYIFEIVINGKYHIQVMDDNHEGAKSQAIEFYSNNNYFTEKIISSTSSRVLVRMESVINSEHFKFSKPIINS